MVSTQRNESDEELLLPDYSREELKAMQEAKQRLKADVAELEGTLLDTVIDHSAFIWQLLNTLYFTWNT
jgi:hypothetical protein